MLFYPALPARPDQSLISGVARLSATSWTPPTRARELDPELAITRIDRALIESVERVSRRRPVGVLCTGGLDSALVAAVAAHVTGRPPTLVAVRGGLSSPIEERLQDELATHLGSRLLTIDRLPAFETQPLIDRNANSDFPTGGAFTHVWDYARDRAFAAGVESLLTGEGGNERFSSGALLGADLLGSHPVAAWSQVSRSRDATSSLTGFLREQALNAGLPTVVRPGRSLGESRQARAANPADCWLGSYAKARTGAARRRRQQLQRMHAAGYGWADADAAIALERHELFDAGDAAGANVSSPLSAHEVGAAVAMAHPAIRNPVRVGTQDKHLLRVVARKYLPASLSETRKVGISHQIAVMTRRQDLNALLEPLKVGWDWLGLEIDASFGRPDLLPSETGLLWTRTLAFGAWALNAVP